MNILIITIGTNDVQISNNPGNGFQIENNRDKLFGTYKGIQMQILNHYGETL